MFEDKEFYWKHKAELYRQDYEDALDEVRELRFRIRELEAEAKRLHDIPLKTNVTIAEREKYVCFATKK